MDIKRILRNYEFESMPLFRSHEENFSALEDLKNLWKKLDLCEIEAKLTTIHDRKDHTTSCTSHDHRQTVISYNSVVFLRKIQNLKKASET